MPRWGMVIDLDKCTGCQACVVACRVENNVPFAGPEETAKGRAIFWMEVRTFLEGEFPHVKARYMPTPCMHCEKPPCTTVCPTGATYKDDQGTVAQIYPRCIGCRYCMNACPYSVKFFNWYPPDWPETMQNFNPDVSVRSKGVVEKCTFCHHRPAITASNRSRSKLTPRDARSPPKGSMSLPACRPARRKPSILAI